MRQYRFTVLMDGRIAGCDPSGMQSVPLILTRRDPSRNMARFYVLSVEPDLFAGAALTRNWGRIGTKGRFRIELFGTSGEAQTRLAKIAGSKLRRGYRPIVDAVSNRPEGTSDTARFHLGR